MDRVRQEVRRTGRPRKMIYLLGRDTLETLDLDVATLRDPGSHPGATFHALRQRQGVDRCYLVTPARALDPAGTEHRWAILFEVPERISHRRYWMAALEYHVDPHSGLGIPDLRWQPATSEADHSRDLPIFLREIAAPPTGARAAEVEDALVSEPDLAFASGEIPSDQPVPRDARAVVELAAAIGSMHALLTERVKGSIVVRVTGRSWEQWVLGGDLLNNITEVIRWIANHRRPAAEGVALVHLTIPSRADPPVLGIQAIAEHSGRCVETWAPIPLPEGPGDPKVPSELRWSEPVPVIPERGWLGVPSRIELAPPIFE